MFNSVLGKKKNSHTLNPPLHIGIKTLICVPSFQILLMQSTLFPWDNTDT